MHRRGVPVDGVLDDEDHQEREHRGPRVDYELPRVGEPEDRAGNGPRDRDGKCCGERDRVATPPRSLRREAVEGVHRGSSLWPVLVLRHLVLLLESWLRRMLSGWTGATAQEAGL